MNPTCVEAEQAMNVPCSRYTRRKPTKQLSNSDSNPKTIQDKGMLGRQMRDVCAGTKQYPTEDTSLGHGRCC